MNVRISRTNQVALGLIIVALVGYLFDSGSVFGFCLGLGGLLLVYSAFKMFWRRLEARYTDDE